MESPKQRDETFITKLPPELLLGVLHYLDVPEILCLRKTCQELNLITRERQVWIHLLHVYQAFLPIPHNTYQKYHYEDSSLLSYSGSTLERVVRYAKHTGDVWTKSREPPFRLQTKIHGEHHSSHGYRTGYTLLGLKLFLDRWLLVVYAEGVASLYDVCKRQAHPFLDLDIGFGEDDQFDSESRKFLKGQLDGSPWNSFSAVFDEVSSSILLFVTTSSQAITLEIYAISLHSLNRFHHANRFNRSLFQPVGYKNLPSQRSIRYADPTRQVVILSSSNKIEVLQWGNIMVADHVENSLSWNSIQRSNHVDARTLPEDLEELWNGVLGSHLLGDYVLVFRTRTLEIYHYSFPHSTDNGDGDPLRIPQGNNKMHVQLKHAFSLTFRDVSFSNVAASSNPASKTDSYELKLLAYDVIQGLFQYVVKLLVPHPTTTQADLELNAVHPQFVEPTLEVRLLGVYPLSFGGTYKSNKRSSLMSSVSSSLTMEPSTSGATTPTPVMNQSHSLFQTHMTMFGVRGTSTAARGFISAHSMGPQGKRAVWVERKRSSTVREVQVWAMEPPGPFAVSDEGGISDQEERGAENEVVKDDDLPVEFENQVVYSANSYDLRDDIVLCTFSELHGTIVLGHRSGEVSVLDLA